MKKTVLTATIAAVALGAFAGTAALAHGGMMGKQMMFTELDSDGDGMISTEEFQARAQARFDRLDADEDGTLTTEELQAARQERMGKRTGFGQHGGNREDRAARMIEMMDQDGDGVLSQDELASGPNPARIFERIDADGDGSISQEEFEEARKMFAGRAGKGGFRRGH